MNQTEINSLLQCPAKADPCQWSQDDTGTWFTSCGNGFDLTTAEYPAEAGMKFCCYCGKPIMAKKYSEEKR
jgi:hypothetical protein